MPSLYDYSCPRPHFKFTVFDSVKKHFAALFVRSRNRKTFSNKVNSIALIFQHWADRNCSLRSAYLAHSNDTTYLTPAMPGFLETSLKKFCPTVQMEIAYTLSKWVQSESWHEAAGAFKFALRAQRCWSLTLSSALNSYHSGLWLSARLHVMRRAWQNLQPRAPSSPNSSRRNQVCGLLLDQPKW